MRSRYKAVLIELLGTVWLFVPETERREKKCARLYVLEIGAKAKKPNVPVARQHLASQRSGHDCAAVTGGAIPA